MSMKRASLEVIAPTVEEAIANGLNELGLSEDAVEVEVLDPGSRGLFGLGSRQARVRLTIKEAASAGVFEDISHPVTSDTPPAAPPAPVVETPQTVSTSPVEHDSEAVEEQAAPSPVVEGDVDEDLVLRVARDTVSDLLEKMSVRAVVTASYGEADDAQSRVPVRVDVHGSDLSILIGPRAETLNALQYIAALIVGKELGRSIPLIVDVEGYRQRREQQIRQLARRMAEQAVKTGRRQVLEPMPANERRLIHIELRSHPDVTTQSIGEEPRRKVTIIPEK
jgi:spoIIIJ-associated protein